MKFVEVKKKGAEKLKNMAGEIENDQVRILYQP